MKYIKLSVCFVLLNFGRVTFGDRNNDERPDGSVVDSIIMDLLPKKVGYNGELRSRLFDKNFTMYADLRGKRSSPNDLRIQGMVSLDSPLSVKIKSMKQRLDVSNLANNLKYNVDLSADGLSKTHLTVENNENAFRKSKIEVKPNKTDITTVKPKQLIRSTAQNDSNEAKLLINLIHEIPKPYKFTNEMASASKLAAPNEPSEIKPTDQKSKTTESLEPASKNMPKGTEMDHSSTPMIVDKGTPTHMTTANKSSQKHVPAKTPSQIETNGLTTKVTTMSHSSEKAHSEHMSTFSPPSHIITTMKPPSSVSKPPSGTTLQHTEFPSNSTTMSPKNNTKDSLSPPTKLTTTTEKPADFKTGSPPSMTTEKTSITNAKVNGPTTKNSTNSKKSLGSSLSPVFIVSLVVPLIIIASG